VWRPYIVSVTRACTICPSPQSGVQVFRRAVPVPRAVRRFQPCQRMWRMSRSLNWMGAGL
jgi:hypothetical protein